MNQDFEKGIDFVFSQNLKLAKIGTKKQYGKYLKTIFPESKFQDIVYHHSNKKIKKFRDNFVKGYAAKHGVSPKAIFFLENPAKKEFLFKRLYLGAYLLNLENPLKYKSKFKIGTKEAKAHSGIKEGIDFALKNKNDGVLFGKIWDNRAWSKVVVAFSSKQIYVLGSKKDLRNFKKFIS